MKAKTKTAASKANAGKKKAGSVKDIPPRKNPYGGAARNLDATSVQRPDL